MRKVLSFLLALTLLLSNLLVLSACKKKPTDDSGLSDDTLSNVEKTDVRIPEYHEYSDRSSVILSDMVYERPDTSALTSKASLIATALQSSTLSLSEATEAITSFEAMAVNFRTMLSLADFNFTKNTYSEFWGQEYSYLSRFSPYAEAAAEKVYVAAAQSSLASDLEAACFSDGFLDDYTDGAVYTERLLCLLESEAADSFAYRNLTKNTVSVTYKETTDTAANLISYYRNKYGETSVTFLQHQTKIEQLYRESVESQSVSLFLSLLRTRKSIAVELGYTSYYNLCLSQMNVTPVQFDSVTSVVRDNVLPIFRKLSDTVFYDALELVKSPVVSTADVLNTLCDLLEETDESVFDVYRYMLQFGLFNVDSSDEIRSEQNAVFYHESSASPILFATFTGKIQDYLTVSYSFGEYLDLYLNGTDAECPLLKKSISFAESMLILLDLADSSDSDDYLYLKLYAMRSALETLMYASVYSEFEEAAYGLLSENITEESLKSVAVDVAAKYGLSLPENCLPYVINQTTALSPVSSAATAFGFFIGMEIFLKEMNTPDAGTVSLKTLLAHGCNNSALSSLLDNAGLSEPWKVDSYKAILNSLYYSITGVYYYPQSTAVSY